MCTASCVLFETDILSEAVLFPVLFGKITLLSFCFMSIENSVLPFCSTACCPLLDYAFIRVLLFCPSVYSLCFFPTWVNFHFHGLKYCGLFFFYLSKHLKRNYGSHKTYSTTLLLLPALNTKQ